MEALELIARVLTGFVFITAGLLKMRQTPAVADAIRAFDLVSERFVRFLAVLLPWVELALGLGIVSGVAVPVFAGTGVILLLVFTGALVTVLRRRAFLACACFGSLAGERVSPLAIARNLVLLVLLLTVLAARDHAFALGGPPAPSQDPVELVLAVAIVMGAAVMYQTLVTILGLELPANQTAEAHVGRFN